jgi:hypothetical protein
MRTEKLMSKYNHRYKHGKQIEPMSFREFRKKVERSKLNSEKRGFIWLLYYAGCRKSEAYERTANNCRVTDSHFIIDFGQRKKNGAKVNPLRFPRSWPGIEILVSLYERAAKRKPKKKRIFFQENEITKSKVVKDRWIFPHIQSVTAWRIVKDTLGPKYYPHFLRLNRLTEIGSDPEANIVRLKSYSGIKSIKALESYLGTSVEEQQAAISWMEKKMKD